MTYNRVGLGTVVQMNPKLSPKKKPNPHDQVSFVPMASVSESTQALDGPLERRYEEVNKGFTSFSRGDILVAKITPCFENGKMARTDDLPCTNGFGSTEFHVIRPSNEVNTDYLFHLLRAPYVRLEGARKMRGAAGQRRVPADFIAGLQIPLPPLPEQKRIAQILDAADALRAKRRESIAQLDALVQSTFLEMFGDPQINPFNFPIGTLSDFYVNKRDGTKCGPFGSALKKSEIVETGIPVWNMDNISISSQMSMPFRMWITKEKYNDLIGYSVLNGDILISRAGTVGKMCVVNLDCNAGIISTNLIRLRLGHDLLPEYFVALMTYCKGRVGRLRTGPDGAFTHMNTGVLDNLRFPVPPFELQERFLSVHYAIQREKSHLTAHLSGLNTLFASLQSRAFNGEL